MSYFDLSGTLKKVKQTKFYFAIDTFAKSSDYRPRVFLVVVYNDNLT